MHRNKLEYWIKWSTDDRENKYKKITSIWILVCSLRKLMKIEYSCYYVCFFFFSFWIILFILSLCVRIFDYIFHFDSSHKNSLQRKGKSFTQCLKYTITDSWYVHNRFLDKVKETRKINKVKDMRMSRCLPVFQYMMRIGSCV